MRAEIICVGTELLTGDVPETNGSLIRRRLIDAGIEPAYQVTVGDDRDRIAGAIRVACGRVDVLVLAGGLGPTHDDLTREALAEATGRALEFQPELYEALRSFFAAKGRPMSPANRAQAQLPSGAQAIPNRLGTAPGIALEHAGVRIFALPGVPGEMAAMLDAGVIPALGGGSARPRSVSRTLRTVGIGESDVADRLGDVIEGCRDGAGLSISILAAGGQVAVGLRAEGADRAAALARIQPVEEAIRERLGADLFGVDDQTLEAVVVEQAAERGMTLGVAESFTGGLLAARLVSVPGASKVFRAGLVAYAPASKVTYLGVEQELLDRYGAVSEEAAAALAEGVRRTSGASIGLSTTGEAGPDALEKPVGTIFVGMSVEGETSVRGLRASGDRQEIRSVGCAAALDALRRFLLGSGAR